MLNNFSDALKDMTKCIFFYICVMVVMIFELSSEIIKSNYLYLRVDENLKLSLLKIN